MLYNLNMCLDWHLPSPTPSLPLSQHLYTPHTSETTQQLPMSRAQCPPCSPMWPQMTGFPDFKGCSSVGQSIFYVHVLVDTCTDSIFVGMKWEYWRKEWRLRVTQAGLKHFWSSASTCHMWGLRAHATTLGAMSLSSWEKVKWKWNLFGFLWH